MHPARFLGATDSLGAVRAGNIADLVLLEGDPLEDVRNTRRIRAVVLNGQLLTRDELSALRERVLLENHRKALEPSGPARSHGGR